MSSCSLPGGLSPRGRGKRSIRTSAWPRPGSIPAWAGETVPAGRRMMSLRVYPRVGGGNPTLWQTPGRTGGLSPRGRGKRLPGHPARPLPWSIPAWAGGNYATSNPALANYGLSPRGRGKRQVNVLLQLARGSIPAWAGETVHSYFRMAAPRVYPRVGGGNRPRRAQDDVPQGLSPRGRGKPNFVANAWENRRSIPAWAGETPLTVAAKVLTRVYPRVGGGNEVTTHGNYQFHGLSPRGRGKLILRNSDDYYDRSIPAWAGETSCRYMRLLLGRVYPRVGGGNVPDSQAVLMG